MLFYGSTSDWNIEMLKRSSQDARHTSGINFVANEDWLGKIYLFYVSVTAAK